MQALLQRATSYEMAEISSNLGSRNYKFISLYIYLFKKKKSSTHGTRSNLTLLLPSFYPHIHAILQTIFASILRVWLDWLI